MIQAHGTDEQSERYLPRMATGELRVRVLDDRAARGLRRPGDPHARRPRRRRVRRSRGQKMWVTNGLRAGAMMLLAEDRPGRRAAPPRHDRVRRREGAGGRRSSRGCTIPAEAEEARLQGRRVDRARLRRLPDAGGERARRRERARPGLQAVHGRHRARPREHRRARGRHRHGAPSRTRSATRRSARRSASRSPSTRRSS